MRDALGWLKKEGSSGFRVGNRVVFFLPRTVSAWLEACRVMSNRVHGIMLLVGAGLALPNQASDPRRAQQAAPLRFRYHHDRQSRYPHHFLKSQNEIDLLMGVCVMISDWIVPLATVT